MVLSEKNVNAEEKKLTEILWSPHRSQSSLSVAPREVQAGRADVSGRTRSVII
jgi:hypothetical protein